jgi:hypothetical protein
VLLMLRMGTHLGAFNSHFKMLFSMDLYRGRYPDLETFARRKQENCLLNCRLATQHLEVAI